jgi:hypothetical protein
LAKEQSFFFTFLFVLDEESFLKVFRLFSFSLLCFFSLSRFALNFFFFGSARGFFFQQATTFDSSLKQTREKKEKDFETFLSLFFPLFDTNNTTLALTQRQRRRTRPVLFILLPCVVKFYIERKTVRKEERLILIGLRIIIPRRPRKTQN